MLPAAAYPHLLLRWLGLAFLCAGLSGSALRAQSVSLRLMSGNLTSGNNQAYDLPSVSAGGEGARIFSGLNPDIVMIQEFNYAGNTAGDLRTFVDRTFGTEFSFYREAGAQIPNGIISRYPILASGEWDDPEVTNRDFAYARIDIPGAIDLWVVSVHLLTDSTRHTDEGDALLAMINSKVPKSALLAIGGDFNSKDRNDDALTILDAVVETDGPYPVDQKGDADTNASRALPYDGIYVDAELAELRKNTVIGGAIFANGAVIDTRVFNSSTIGAIDPARTTDSGVQGMQHMAIVRDFAIPIPEPGAGFLLSGGFLLLVSRRKWIR